MGHTTVQAHRSAVTLEHDGTLTLDRLPFPAGEAVEVIVLPLPVSERAENRYPLRGTAVRFEHPFEPVDADAWTVLP